jgi:hypothetical protein
MQKTRTASRKNTPIIAKDNTDRYYIFHECRKMKNDMQCIAKSPKFKSILWYLKPTHSQERERSFFNRQSLKNGHTLPR